MRYLSRFLVTTGALLVAGVTSAQSTSNDYNRNNGGDVVFIYSSPSSGFSSLAFPPDVTGDLYWKAEGAMNDVAAVIGSAMEIDGYYESLFDTDWATTPSFYSRMHGPSVANGLGGLEPAFFTLGLGGGAYTDTVVTVGPSGFGNPCTIAPSLCSPSGGTCPPPGFVNGYLVDLQFGSTVGSGVVVPANGTATSNYALTYFVTGGMTASGGGCGLGDYDLQDVHSTNESQADPGAGINPDGGFQLAGGGAVNDAVASMLEGHETFRENIFQPIANSGLGGGVENGDNGGGAMNGFRLPVASGLATLGGELRDLDGVGASLIGIGAISLTPLGNPGLPILGGNLLILPDGLFNSTSQLWQAPILNFPVTFTTEGRALFQQLPVPTTASGVTVVAQAARLVLTGPVLSLNSSNVVVVRFFP